MKKVVNGVEVTMTSQEAAAVQAEWDAWEETTPIPQSITPLQARKVLRANNLKAQVDAYVASLSEEAQDEWEYCLEVRRDHPVIVDGGAALGMSDEQLDALFVAGAAL